MFISHASEDKDGFVRDLAERLRDSHIEVWYDEFSLNIGDGLRRSIDRGLTQARFGVVVLSPHFFAKQWPQWELDGLVARQNDGDRNVLLPIWHNVTRSDVRAFSPPLADKVATLSSEGLDAVVKKLAKVIRPQGSSLIEARDYLIERGWESPPVISDDWWLDMASEASYDRSGVWERWEFPLPPWDNDARARGHRIAQAALQNAWRSAANDQRISQLTPPERVHEFIRSHPGLLDTCLKHVSFVVEYAPQLAITGFGGPLEQEIERSYQVAVERGRRSVSEQLALHAPDFFGMDPAYVACHYVQGSLMGPSTSFYEPIDVALWLLSDTSTWLPSSTRAFLTQGMIEWHMWPWDANNLRFANDFGFRGIPATGALFERLYQARSAETVRITQAIRSDMEHRFGFTSQLLNLPETGSELTQRFIDARFIEGWFEGRRKTRAR
ncbi:TIR domain-containing protein [Propionicimonas paludicola]|uniref:TIR domain-containing protein n=1 Tax=Propionicimonas paludicola TaxID=185243 RepID=A0A2A9CNH7_9ACTN|nr:TIR domain-containing protein [Propionicimonas paludicola]